MEEAGTNPIFIAFFWILRCVVPLLVLLGISYLLRRVGVIEELPKPPPDWDDGNEDNNEEQHQAAGNGKGGLTHA
jgi:hypothetical protein